MLENPDETARDSDAEPVDAGVLQPLLKEAFESSAARWPELALSIDAFTAFVQERVNRSELLESQLANLHLEDLFLACAAAARTDRSAAVFERDIMRHVPQSLRRSGLVGDAVDEALSQARIRLLVGTERGPARVNSYHGRGPLQAFAAVVAMREASAVLKKTRRRASVQLEDWLPASPTVESPELGVLRDRGRSAIKKAVKSALSDLSPRDRNVLHLYYVDGTSSEAIGRVYRVHRATVARWITGARERLLKSSRGEMMRELAFEPAEFTSFMNDFSDGFDVTLTTFLDE